MWADLAFYHEVQEQLKKMLQYFEFAERREIRLCRFYGYDAGACEEYCRHLEIKRTGDFDSKQECWKCVHRERKVVILKDE